MIRILNTYKLYIINLVVMSTLFSNTNAQDITVKAKLDTSEFLVGDQVGLVLEVKHPIKEFVGIPNFDETLGDKLEILEQSKHDTTLLESGHYLIKKRLLITAFDTGYYVMPPITFLYYSDTLRSEPLAFKVNAIVVDTSQAFKDIKMPYAAPLSFAEVFPWASGGLGLAILIFIIIYILRKIKRNEPILGRIKPREPAHIIALRDLTRLKDDKLWQHDKTKSYYTILTDILRLYLWNRYSIRTLERTSEEILDSLKASDFKDDELLNSLKDIFYTSDLVKFAKFKPIADEHERCLKGAYGFVDKTKLIIEEKTDGSAGGKEDVETDSIKDIAKVKEVQIN
jgi:hypothetical protein